MKNKLFFFLAFIFISNQILSQISDTSEAICPKYLITEAAQFQFSDNTVIFIDNEAYIGIQTNKNNTEIFTDKNKYDLALKESESADSLINSGVQKTERSIFLPVSEFYYADMKRTTMDGSLPFDETNLKLIPSLVMGAACFGIFYAQHYGQMETIWKDKNPEGFRFVEDGQYALYADKIGHFFGSYLSSYIMSESLMMIGFSWDASVIGGTFLGLAYETYVEILDGYGKNWGFSPTDFYADVVGAAYFAAQHYIPFLQNFTPKFLYVPAEWHGELSRKPHDMFIDDYSSHTLWLNINVHNLLPKAAKPYWPSWLELSLGYAVRNICGSGEKDPSRDYVSIDKDWDIWGSPRYIVSLDYNLAKVIPEGGGFLGWLRQSMMYFKFPSPAIEFGATTKFYLVYPFPIKLGAIRF